MSGFFEELKRRKVYRVAIAYVVAGWALPQGLAQVLPVFDVSNSVIRSVIALLLIGFPVVLVLAWVFDVTPQGIRATPTPTIARSHRRRNIIMLVATGVAISAAAGFFLLPGVSARKIDKSIAVLPFENLSEEKTNAFFADGMQDEILTNLSKIADLRVISRTSVMQYKSGIARNLREIGQQLGVAHVVEGSVQRSGNRVRVNAQLVDVRTDRHLWGQTYDRDLADVFAIQSEIAKSIADQLEAKLSPIEKDTIERPPTTDVTAFDLYTLAKNLCLTAFGSSTTKANLLLAADLLNKAVARDPSFFQAYCLLAMAHAGVYFVGFDHTPARLAQAESAVQAASRLQPSSGETHLARAQNLYWGYLDYDGALAELEVAAQGLPNDPRVVGLKGYIERRQGRWDESIRDLKRAIELDPHNILTLQQTAQTYQGLRLYVDEKSLLARVLAFEPNDAVTKVQHAFVELDSKADTQPLNQMIESIRVTNPAAIPSIANNWLVCALVERDGTAAKNALIAFGESPITFGSAENVLFNRLFVEGVIARIISEEDRARSAFIAARAEQEKLSQITVRRCACLV